MPIRTQSGARGYPRKKLRLLSLAKVRMLMVSFSCLTAVIPANSTLKFVSRFASQRRSKGKEAECLFYRLKEVELLRIN